MAVDPERIREWRDAAQKYADMAVKLMQVLPEEPTDSDYAKISMVASISSLYYATALDADHFGDGPDEGATPEK
ncbi:hypothetical protein [Mycobacterium paraense]|uniref:hypothetical protein n=1 Tax=Mycobacterium paraense TaxID=767916 RepID=UPI00111BFC7E|nr:hypothetical protein [Mycobacterium paraense]MCV7440898.1 hypothetical protein [Mycobacterium paraense]